MENINSSISSMSDESAKRLVCRDGEYSYLRRCTRSALQSVALNRPSCRWLRPSESLRQRDRLARWSRSAKQIKKDEQKVTPCPCLAQASLRTRIVTLRFAFARPLGLTPSLQQMCEQADLHLCLHMTLPLGSRSESVACSSPAESS